MQRWASLSGPIKNSIIVVMLGVLGLLAMMQWTANTVRRHVRITSQSLFPAALKSQQAGTAFQRMNREYSDAVVMQQKASLASAGRDAATIMSSLDSAGKLMEFNLGRHEQIVALMRRISGLQMRSRLCYTVAASTKGDLPKSLQADLADLGHENAGVQTALETLQSDLASDFRGELALIGKLSTIQAIFESVLFVVVIIVLFFSTRAFIDRQLSAQQSILDNERKMLRALIDNIPDFMYVKDTESRFVVANPQVARAAGVQTPEELLGKTDFDFFPRELATAFYEDEQNLIRSGVPLYNREEKGVDGAGNETHILTTKVPLRDSRGRVTHLAGVGRDISERKKTEDALREAERKYRGIFDEAIVGMFQSTPDGRFLSVNRAMARIFGFRSPEEMMASITDISRQMYVIPKRYDEFCMVMDRLGSMLSLECEAFRKDGAKIWIASSGRAVRQNRMVVRYEGMIEDITERKLLRGQLLQAQKLESIGQLAAGIAHEINTPTQYIGDNVRFLKDAFRDLESLLASYERLFAAAKESPLSPETMEELAATAARTGNAGYLLEEIPKAIEQTLEGITRVATLVAAMKEFSHPGTKEKTSLDLNHAIESTITVARNEWKYVADVETEFDSSLPPISCLPGEFNQVILNLIVNAAHAIADVVGKGGPEKGKIRVQTRNCSDWVEIRIQDTGTGIPENVQSRIFDPFFTTKEIGKGTGQGLAIARSAVVDKHGGSLHFETEQGKGTTFVIRLPHDGKHLASKAVSA
jgi:PAS domain S-box-containing protein